MKPLLNLLALTALFAGSSPCAAEKPLNILVLYADDWRHDTPEKHQRMMKNYYRMATEVDSTCGRILQELKKQGVLDNNSATTIPTPTSRSPGTPAIS